MKYRWVVLKPESIAEMWKIVEDYTGVIEVITPEDIEWPVGYEDKLP